VAHRSRISTLAPSRVPIVTAPIFRAISCCRLPEASLPGRLRSASKGLTRWIHFWPRLNTEVPARTPPASRVHGGIHVDRFRAMPLIKRIISLAKWA